MADLQGISILLVEDERDLKQLFLWDFESFDAHVETAETFEEAIEKLNSRRFDAVISDVKLPDGTGVDLFRYIGSKKIEIPKKYFMTAFTSEELDLENLNVDKLFKKPLKTRDVVDFIAHELGLRPA